MHMHMFGVECVSLHKSIIPEWCLNIVGNEEEERIGLLDFSDMALVP